MQFMSKFWHRRQRPKYWTGGVKIPTVMCQIIDDLGETIKKKMKAEFPNEFRSFETSYKLFKIKYLQTLQIWLHVDALIWLAPCWIEPLPPSPVPPSSLAMLVSFTTRVSRIVVRSTIPNAGTSSGTISARRFGRMLRQSEWRTSGRKRLTASLLAADRFARSNRVRHVACVLRVSCEWTRRVFVPREANRTFVHWPTTKGEPPNETER